MKEKKCCCQEICNTINCHNFQRSMTKRPLDIMDSDQVGSNEPSCKKKNLSKKEDTSYFQNIIQYLCKWIPLSAPKNEASNNIIAPIAKMAEMESNNTILRMAEVKRMAEVEQMAKMERMVPIVKTDSNITILPIVKMDSNITILPIVKMDSNITILPIVKMDNKFNQSYHDKMHELIQDCFGKIIIFPDIKRFSKPLRVIF